MKAKIDLEKFICSLMKRYYEIHNIDPLTTRCWLDKVLEDQGLEYKDGEIVEISQEGEDEKIIKALKEGFKYHQLFNPTFGGIPCTEIINWLEKQGQQKPFDYETATIIQKDFAPKEVTCTQEVETGNGNIKALVTQKSPVESLGISQEKYNDIVNECIYGEDADKVEPKFHEGEWITDGNITIQIEAIKNDCYLYCGDCTLYSTKTADKVYHLWTIQDAKPGDVLACEDGWTCIFKSLNDGDTFGSYCFMDSTKWFCEKGGECHTLNTEHMKAYHGEIKPATKEQRDTLMKAIADAGYTFDFEKKELKKNDTLLYLLHKMPSCIIIDGIDYHFVLKKTITYMAFYEGEGEGRDKIIFWMAGEPIELLTAMLEKLKEEELLESF